eukprot:4299541-Pyramimonas_sp.AAC.1
MCIRDRAVGRRTPQQRARRAAKPPWMDYFKDVECGGSGDCFFLCIGRAFRDAAADPEPLAAGGDQQGGEVQARMRLLFSAEMEKKHSK